MRTGQVGAIDPGTAVNVADGPVAAAGDWLHWDSFHASVLNVVIIGLVIAILAVWLGPTSARPIASRRPVHDP